MTYLEKLNSRIAATGSNLCVGIDPRAQHADGGLEAFVMDIVEQTAPYAAAFKPNIAYFEAYGAAGVAILERCLRRMPADIPVVLDVKRGDIPETMRHYAEAYFGRWNVDAVTLNGYMGFDCIEPFLQDAARGVYLLAVTSNPGAGDIELRQVGGRYVFELVQDYAERAAGLPGTVGLVVGLTNISDDVLSRVRDLPLLVPGLGAQGGDLSRLDLARRRAPILVNASRSVLYGDRGTPADRAREARDRIAHASAKCV